MRTHSEGKKKGRPPGRQYDKVLHIRLPAESVRALKELAGIGGVSVSEIVRSGILASLAHAIEPLAKTVNDDSRPARKRLTAIKRLRKIMEAGLHMGPVGLQLARAKAAGKL